MRAALFRRLAVAVAVLSVAGATRAVAGGPAGPAPAAAPIDRQAHAATMSTGGYWLVGSDGSVYPFGAPAHGSLSGQRLSRPITGAAVTPSGAGYWLVGTDGGIFAFGDAGFFGSTGAMRLNKPIVGMAGTPTGAGYWLVASDGGIFAFGDAGFFGSTGAMRLNKPIVGMASTPTGRGYWLVASDGGIFAFGDAGFYGSTGAIILNKPITGMSASRSGRGYRFVATDGGLFSFGDAAYAGSAAGRRMTNPIVGMAGSPTGNGYWLVGASGMVYSFGDAKHEGSTAGAPLPAPVVTIVAPPNLPNPPAGGPAPNAPNAPPLPPAAPGDGAPEVPAPAADGPFKIALIGDSGYNAEQDRIMLKARTAISSRPYAFVVHDGDIQHPDDPCSDERLQYVYELFDGFSSPLIYTPGDNEWADCSNSKERLAAIRQRFFSTDRSLGQRRLTLTRQGAPWVENARWTAGNVVFATMNVPGPTGRSSGAPGQHDANVDWLNAAFDTAEAQQSRGVMIIWQDDPFDGDSDEDLEEVLIRRARAFNKPVVLVHGDTHQYRLGKAWREAPNMIEVETYAQSDVNNWVEVTIDPADPEVFSFSRQRA